MFGWVTRITVAPQRGTLLEKTKREFEGGIMAAGQGHRTPEPRLGLAAFRTETTFCEKFPEAGQRFKFSKRCINRAYGESFS